MNPAPTIADEQTGPGRRVRATPASVWLITALWAALMLGASVLWPATYGYDEPQHIDMAYVYSARPFHFYDPGTLLPTEANVGMQRLQAGYPPKMRFSEAPVAARANRPSFAQLGGHTPTTGTQPNQMVQHPPLYYWLEAAVLRVPSVSHLAWDVQVWLMRLLSVIMLLPLPWLCWAATRRLLASDTVMALNSPDALSALAVPAAVVPLTVPNLVRDGASVSNDALLILATSTLLYLLSRVVTGDLTRRTAAWIAISLAAALLTKGFGLVLPPVVLAAYLLGGWRQADSKLRALWQPLLIAAAGGVGGGLWWLRNLVQYGTIQTNGFGAAYNRFVHGPPDDRGTFTRFAPQFISDFVERIWGGIGLPDTPSPGPFIIYTWFVVVAIGIVAALLVREAAGDRLRAAVLFSVAVLTVLLVAKGSFSGFHHWSTTPPRAAQGRYLYHLVVALAALATVGWLRVLRRRVHHLLTPTILIGAVLTNAAVWVVLLRSWYQPAAARSVIGGAKDAAHGLLRWSPLPVPVTVLLVGVLPAALSILAAVVTIQTAGRLRGSSDAYDDEVTEKAALPVG